MPGLPIAHGHGQSTVPRLPGWARVAARAALLALRAARSLRSALPSELRDQFNSLVREVLLTLRALIDWYLEKLGPGEPEERVEDITIE